MRTSTSVCLLLLVGCGRIGYDELPVDAGSDAGRVDVDGGGGTPGVSPLTDWQPRLVHSTAPGAARLLLVFLLSEDDDLAGPGAELTAMTYAGQPMTRVPGVGRIVADGSAENIIEAWYLGEAGLSAAVGVDLVPTFTHTPSEAPHYASITLGNVDQTTPFGDDGATSCTDCNGLSVAPLETRAGDLAVAAASHGMATPLSLFPDYVTFEQSFGSHQSVVGYKPGTGAPAIVAESGTRQRHALMSFVVNRR